MTSSHNHMHRVLATLGYATLIALFAVPQQCPAQTTPIKIGVMLCLTGDCAEWGTNGLRGAQVAAEQINLAGGVLGKQIELVVEDSHDTTPADAVSAFKKIILDGDVKYLVGPTWTVGGMPIAPIAKQHSDLILTSPSVGIRDFNETASNILNIWPHDEIATRRLAQYAREQNWKTAAIFGSQDPWVRTQSDTFKEEFEKLGGKIVSRVEPLPGSRDLRSEALQIKRSNPDVVFFSNYQVDVFAKEMAKLQFSRPKLAILMEKDRVKAAKGTLEGTVFALYEDPPQQFKSRFQEKFGAQPGITADTSYDIIMLYAKAMRESGSTETSKTLPLLLSVKDYHGASGVFSINEKGAVNKAPVLWKVSGLEYVYLKL